MRQKKIVKVRLKFNFVACHEERQEHLPTEAPIILRTTFTKL
jgi:hypothetical protein